MIRATKARIRDLRRWTGIEVKVIAPSARSSRSEGFACLPGQGACQIAGVAEGLFRRATAGVAIVTVRSCERLYFPGMYHRSRDYRRGHRRVTDGYPNHTFTMMPSASVSIFTRSGLQSFVKGSPVLYTLIG